MSCKLSVIIPVYNSENFIKRCVESVLSQKGSEKFQIILVDDGSTDNSPAICDELCTKYSNICVLHQQNAGVSAARNSGLEKAEGEWISFIDSDDYLLDGFYESLFSVQDADLLCCDFYFEKGNEFPLIGRYIEEGLYTKEKFADILYPIMAKKTVFYSACNKIFKADIIKDNNLRFIVGKKYGEDMVFVYDYVKHINSFSFVNKGLYGYNYSDGNTTTVVKKGYEAYESTYIYLTNYFKSVGFSADNLKHDYIFMSLGAIYTAAVHLDIFSAWLYIRHILKDTIFYSEYSSKRIYSKSDGINGYLDRFIMKKNALLIVAVVRYTEFKSKHIQNKENEND